MNVIIDCKRRKGSDADAGARCPSFEYRQKTGVNIVRLFDAGLRNVGSKQAFYDLL